jgi:hypothetical protein
MTVAPSHPNLQFRGGRQAGRVILLTMVIIVPSQMQCRQMDTVELSFGPILTSTAGVGLVNRRLDLLQHSGGDLTSCRIGVAGVCFESFNRMGQLAER